MSIELLYRPLKTFIPPPPKKKSGYAPESHSNNNKNLIRWRLISCLLTSGAYGHCPAVLVGQLAARIVDVEATKARQVRSEHAFLDGRHPKGVDGRVIIQVARHVDRHQPVVRHIQQLSCTDLRHLAALVLRPTGV